MPASITKAPPKVALSKNPVPVIINSDDYQVTPAVAAQYIVRFTGTVNPGAELELSWLASKLLFTAAALPNAHGLQFPSGSGNAAHVQAIILWLERNFYVCRDYTLSYLVHTGAPAIQFTARKAGALYNMAPWSAGSIQVLQSVAGVNQVLKPNFAHLVEIWRVGEQQRLWGENLILDLPLTGSTIKDISEILTTYLDYDIPKLDQVWEKCSKSLFNFFIRTAQYYGDTPDFTALATSEIYTAVLGGYSNKALSRIATADHFENYLLPDPMLFGAQRWMETWPIPEFEVRTNQPQFLYFLNMHTEAETLKIKVVVTLSDGSLSTLFVAGGLLQPKEKVCVGCGYQQLGLQSLTAGGKYPVSYTVQLVEDVTGASRTLIKKFLINRRYQRYVRYILYGDSAGNFKTLYCFGENESSKEIVGSQAERPASVGTPVSGDFTRYDAGIIENYSLQTGYVSADQVNAIDEFMLATYAFQVFGDTLLPILNTSKKITPPRDGQNLNAAKIEYRLAYTEKLYTGTSGALLVPDPTKPTNPINDL